MKKQPYYLISTTRYFTAFTETRQAVRNRLADTLLIFMDSVSQIINLKTFRSGLLQKKCTNRESANFVLFFKIPGR